MRPSLSPRRWLQRHPQYSRLWPQNPWINTSSSRPQAADDIAENQQQKAAIGTWEDEGGSLPTDGSVRR